MALSIKDYPNFQWFDFVNPKKTELRQCFEDHGGNSHLMDDILEVGHLPKIEKIQSSTFLLFRALSHKISGERSTISQLTNKIGFFYNESVLITAHQKEFPFLNEIQEQGNIKSPEELMLKILEAMLETYIEPAQWLSDKMDSFEAEIFLKDHKKMSIESLYYDKAKARACKKLILLTQSVMNQIQVEPSHMTKLQDLKETASSLFFQFDEALEDAQALLNTYMSLTSQKTNEVMKLLTIFSAFFLPLTFIVGVYGMNFELMPELKWSYGYFVVWGLMAFMSLLIYFWFKRKKFI
ncbi:CorA family divalent cation transporter [Algoriphagus taiwanensis]|uniref:Magnesium/cobalt transporter CorA n=1 Tax=Algoriphagus taiwanensis TaxID=1445656 RepID=A0ABQ6Q063_9BACT|nr:magnesium/cobalt transporter CorA [Algoriphagus taiwanensis]